MSRNDTDARQVYADIINLPHWQSPKRPHMSEHDRAAQFAPFAALTGYDDMISEEARLVEDKVELEDYDEINRALSFMGEALAAGKSPTVTVTFFVPDQRKAGGSYKTIEGAVHKFDSVNKQLVVDGVTIAIADILYLCTDEE